MINRRVFVKSSGLALLALGLPPAFVTRSLLAETSAARRKKTLICIFQRGAVDGLSMVVPFAEPEYARVRRSILIPAPARGSDESALDLDGFFGLHPSLEPLHELWTQRELAIVHATGSPHPTRSHFDAQDYMETATPGRKSGEGWLNRVLAETGCGECEGRRLEDGAAHTLDHAAAQAGMASDALRGIAISSGLPLSLRGEHPALAIRDIARFGVGADPATAEALRKLYGEAEGDALAATASEAFDAMDVIRGIDARGYTPRDGVEYPNSEFGRALRQIAQLVKADVGLEVAFAELGGWDTHAGQGGVRGQLANRFGDLARGLRALHDDLGDAMQDVVILTMSEFGRTVAENGAGGTDHGHANCMLVLGGGVDGGRVLGDWPGLAPEQLYQGRDLAVTTDFRDVFAEVAARHLGAGGLERVFPGHEASAEKWRGVLG